MTVIRAGIAVEATPIVVPTVPHPFWTLRRAAAALGPLLLSGPRLDDRTLSGVATDSRTLPHGALFVALRGAQHDAHAWLEQARDAGAAAVVVERPEATAGLGIPVLVVSDTLCALGALARGWRRAWGGTVVAVGGSNGKTTTKEMLRVTLGSHLTVHATAGNQNNLVGVPLTLLSIPSYANVAVVEVGTNAPGEIERLRAICEPDIVVVTSLGEEHLEGLGDLAGVLREESAIFSHARIAVVPVHEAALIAAAERHHAHVIRAGIADGDVHADSFALDAEGRGALVVEGHAVTLPLRGAHQGPNAMLALAVSQAVGVPIRDAVAALEHVVAPAMRGSWESIGALTVINDAYNANPPSMRAALQLMRAVGAGRQKVAVLGTMRELGSQSEQQHDAVAREALHVGLDIIVAVGEFGPAFARVAPGDARVVRAADPDTAWTQLQPVLSRDALVLLKGSRGERLERLLSPLTTWATS